VASDVGPDRLLLEKVTQRKRWKIDIISISEAVIDRERPNLPGYFLGFVRTELSDDQKSRIMFSWSRGSFYGNILEQILRLR
jgi:hypothetical protein